MLRALYVIGITAAVWCIATYHSIEAGLAALAALVALNGLRSDDAADRHLGALHLLIDRTDPDEDD